MHDVPSSSIHTSLLSSYTHSLFFDPDQQYNFTCCLLRHGCPVGVVESQVLGGHSRCRWSWPISRNAAQLATFVALVLLTVAADVPNLVAAVETFPLSRRFYSGGVTPSFRHRRRSMCGCHSLLDLGWTRAIALPPTVVASATFPPPNAAASRSKQCTTAALLAGLFWGQMYSPNSSSHLRSRNIIPSREAHGV